MIRRFISALLGVMFTLSAIGWAQAEEPKRGKLTGSVMHNAPGWFKESFLEIQDDVDEAAAANKHVILFFQLNGCPYCDAMLTESFESKTISSYVQEHFDTISINARGDREIVFNENTTMNEKELSQKLNVFATPAILFLDKQNKTVVRVNGYRSPERFKKILSYVAEKHYQKITLAEYLERNLSNDIYQFRDHKLFTKADDLSIFKGPLALIFEDSSCYDCNEFHEKHLENKQVLKELKPYTVVRLNADSSQVLIDVDGSKTTARALAKKHNMTYRPGMLMFNEGKLIRRYDSLMFPHHFKEGLRYVAGGYYKTQSYGSYSQQRTEELLSQGVTIDISR
ncbi:MAG: thioredoxin fold domain-containing protein [Gammaproteobacteria bacterium]|nr:thioredoxin fold domain-containing protein [Gammaproteobacteria bacterium]